MEVSSLEWTSNGSLEWKFRVEVESGRLEWRFRVEV